MRWLCWYKSSWHYDNDSNDYEGDSKVDENKIYQPDAHLLSTHWALSWTMSHEVLIGVWLVDEQLSTTLTGNSSHCMVSLQVLTTSIRMQWQTVAMNTLQMYHIMLMISTLNLRYFVVSSDRRSWHYDVIKQVRLSFQMQCNSKQLTKGFSIATKTKSGLPLFWLNGGQ